MSGDTAFSCGTTFTSIDLRRPAQQSAQHQCLCVHDGPHPASTHGNHEMPGQALTRHLLSTDSCAVKATPIQGGAGGDRLVLVREAGHRGRGRQALAGHRGRGRQGTAEKSRLGRSGERPVSGRCGRDEKRRRLICAGDTRHETAALPGSWLRPGPACRSLPPRIPPPDSAQPPCSRQSPPSNQGGMRAPGRTCGRAHRSSKVPAAPACGGSVRRSPRTGHRRSTTCTGRSRTLGRHQ